jgi:hypothetical protein
VNPLQLGEGLQKYKSHQAGEEENGMTTKKGHQHSLTRGGGRMAKEEENGTNATKGGTPLSHTVGIECTAITFYICDYVIGQYSLKG